MKLSDRQRKEADNLSLVLVAMFTASLFPYDLISQGSLVRNPFGQHAFETSVRLLSYPMISDKETEESEFKGESEIRHIISAHNGNLYYQLNINN